MTDEITEGDTKEDSDDEDEVPTEPETDEDQAALTQFTDDFQPFTEFPEPVLLKTANDVFTGYKKPVPRERDGTVGAYPCPSWRQDVFCLKDFAELDAYAIQVRIASRNIYFDHQTPTSKY